jgi:VWFA-related protein
MRCCLLLLIAALGFAQEETPLFRTGVSLVKVDVEVQDGSGVGIAGLHPSDFVLYDEGQRQSIADFAAESQPVRVLMLMDVSPSMSKYLSDLGVKSTEALRALRSGDQVALMSFAARSQLVQPFTADTKSIGAQIIGNIFKQTLGRETLVNEALLEAANYMRSQPGKMRNAIIVVTDNEGARKAVSDDAVVRALHAGNVVVSAILVGDTPAPYVKARYTSPGLAPPDVQRFAVETGGEVIVGTAPANALQPVLKGLTTRYSFQYTAPPADDGTFRRIRVELSPEAAARYRGAQIKARSGYTVGEANPNRNRLPL